MSGMLMEAADRMMDAVTPVFSASAPVEDVPVERTASGRAWACASGEHRYHRSRDVAYYCAWQAMPRRTVVWRPIPSTLTGAV